MNQEKIGKFIKDLRIKNNLTQAQLAEKYGVTYQAVSKWENGKNLPDMSLIKQMSKDFNIDINDLLDGEYNTKKRNNKSIYIFKKTPIHTPRYLSIFLSNRNSNFQLGTLLPGRKKILTSQLLCYVGMDIRLLGSGSGVRDSESRDSFQRGGGRG